jgi:hypothetical protein
MCDSKCNRYDVIEFENYRRRVIKKIQTIDRDHDVWVIFACVHLCTIFYF